MFSAKFSKIYFLQQIFSIKNDTDKTHKIITIFGVKFKINYKRLIYNNPIKEIKYYKNALESKNCAINFVPIAEDEINFVPSTKLIAFYLPQFHTFKENEEWHGKGFTEWTNVTKAFPMYEGHNQPQLPIDVGFYDLSTDKVMYRQIELAKQYGIYGFCFHYYWFSGKRLMEKPIFNYLNNKELDLPFCLCWANENWSKRWDGGNNEVLMEQKLKKDDWKKFVEDIAPFLKDERYIKIGNKPMLIIYRPLLFEHDVFIDFVNNIRSEFKNYGIEEVHLVMAKTFGDENLPSYYNMDAAVEFPIHNMRNIDCSKPKAYINDKFKGAFYNMADYINSKKYLYEVNYNIYKTIFPNWDNTARKLYNSLIAETTPEDYLKWLLGCIDWTKEHNSSEEQIVFINAWNEWAEGAHLEPDQKYGYAYLQATKDALEMIRNANK